MRINPKLIEEGYISIQQHPECNYQIYNYTHKAQFDNKWDDDIKKCRGLILQGERIIARPFEKFFNIEQHEYKIDGNIVNVFEKLDGSLGILYILPNGECRIATRGSFTSDQAIEATKILKTKYSNVHFLPQYTYLFEIIYPENRIVCDYKDVRDLILLTIIDNHSGKDLSWKYITEFALKNQMSIVKTFHGINNDLKQLQDLNISNSEGFVILTDTGFRVKIKFEEYKRLHRIVTGLSSKYIWEALSSGQKLEDLDFIPDEFFQWAIRTKIELEARFKEIECYCNYIIGMMQLAKFESMKEIAEYFKTCKYQSVLFNMHRNKPYDSVIWRLIEPEYSRPYGGKNE